MSRSLILALGCTVLGFAGGIFAASAPSMIVTPAQDAVFQPMDAARPSAAQIAVLRGDPTSGPSAMLMKFGKSSGRLHSHSSDYDLVVLEGDMKHWQAGESEASAKVLGPGSYWFQPGGQAHADSCLSEQCLMYVQWSGKRDTRVPETASTNR